MIYNDNQGLSIAVWCQQCERAYLAERVSFSGEDGNAEYCPNEDCEGGGEDLYWWDEGVVPRTINRDYPEIPIDGDYYPLNGV